jgi:hypothetical protein
MNSLNDVNDMRSVTETTSKSTNTVMAIMENSPLALMENIFSWVVSLKIENLYFLAIILYKKVNFAVWKGLLE